MSTTPSSSIGVPWCDQELSIPPVEILVKLRKHIHHQLGTTGRFDFKDTDHNSDNYAGLSNKQLTIVAVWLDPACKNLSWEEKKKVLLRAIGFES